MHSLPDYFTNHRFFRTTKNEMSERDLYLKDKLDNFSVLEKGDKYSIFRELVAFWPESLRQEGFWCGANEQFSLFKNEPFPQANKMSQEETDQFLLLLTEFESKTPFFKCMGYSTCRICGQNNGTSTYYTDLFAWPNGYKHYIQEHGVRPSAAFVLHIRGLIK